MVEKLIGEQITPAVRLPAGEIVAVNVSEEEFEQKYLDGFYEWVRGVVINVAASSLPHAELLLYLGHLLDAYFELNPIGKVIVQSLMMELKDVGSKREPDVMIILKSSMEKVTDTKIKGAADICIEIVSAESVARDYGDKFEEYEKGGVKEYWIIDYKRKVCDFHRLVDDIYIRQEVDTEQNYETPLLPKLKVHVPTLWSEEFPQTIAVGKAVQKMFELED